MTAEDHSFNRGNGPGSGKPPENLETQTRQQRPTAYSFFSGLHLLILDVSHSLYSETVRYICRKTNTPKPHSAPTAFGL